MLARPGFPLLEMAAEIARTHHERWDGTGYPAGLAGEEIPLVGRIVAVADVFDALTHERPYKDAWPVADAVAEIDAQRRRQFDPAVVGAFLAVLPELDLDLDAGLEPRVVDDRAVALSV
jgi:putative two-component system response regulator